MSVSVKDVAALAGVSIGTVSNVLNRPDIVAPKTAKRVRHAIKVLGYVRNDAARQLRAGQSRAIGLVVLDLSNPFFAELARGAEDEAAAAGFTVIVGHTGGESHREQLHLDLFDQQRVQGILITPVGNVDERLHRLADRGIPSVFVDRISSDSAFSSVAVDDVLGGTLAVTHLLDRGARRILYLGGPKGLRQVKERWHGAKRSAAAYPDAHLRAIYLNELTVAAGYQAGASIAADPPSKRPDAIFAANDLIAIGLLQALVAAKINVPGEIRLIGYDDIAFARSTVVSLSSIRQPAAEIGATGVRILLDHAENAEASPRHVVYEPSLIMRDSS